MKKVLMVGPARNVKGGITTVVNNYFKYGLSEKIDLKYIETINDKNKVYKFLKEIKGYIEFLLNIKKFDIVHIHMASRRSTFRKCRYIEISKKNNKKVVLHIHGGGFKKFFEDECKEKEKNQIIKCFKKCDKIIVLSEEWKEFFSELVPSEKIKIIYNGVNIPNDFEKNVNSKKILFLGRINEKKGVYDLLEVIKLLVKKHKDIILDIGGSGEIEKLKLTIEKNELKDNVNFLGWIEEKEKEKELKECAYFVLPSYFEAMPMSILEAMSYKNIVISTNVGGISKIIENEVDGKLITPGNIEELYDTFESLFNNEIQRRNFSNKAREKIENKFNISENVIKTLELYNEII